MIIKPPPHVDDSLLAVRTPLRRGAMLSASLGWSPFDLGTDLLAWWTADRADLMVFNAGNISSIADCVHGYVLSQATPANQPGYSPIAFGGSPAMIFNGNGMMLARASAFSFPVGANPSQIFVVADQQTPSSDVATRTSFQYGSSFNTTRRMARQQNAGLSKQIAIVGQGGTGTGAYAYPPEYFGRHYVFGDFGSTATAVAIDGKSLNTIAAVPATDANNTSLGNLGTTTWLGLIRDAIVTLPLSAPNLALMNAWCAARTNP